jgi:hypothetical protein
MQRSAPAIAQRSRDPKKYVITIRKSCAIKVCA